MFGLKTALIMIDMQNGFLNPESAQCVPGALDTVPACAAAIDYCHSAGIPVFFVTRSYRADGSDVENTRYESWLKGGRAMSPGCPPEISADFPAEFDVCATDYLISKPRFSAFFQTELDLVLRRLGIGTLVLAGTTTPNCIRTTCYDAISLDYNVAVLSDGTSSVSDEIQMANLGDMRRVGAQILSCADFISGAEIRDITAEVKNSINNL